MSILNPRHPHTTVHIIRRVFEAATIEPEPAHEKAPVNGLRLVVGRIPFPDTHRQRVEKFFTHIHYYPDMTKADPKVLQQADVLYGFGAWNVHSFEQIPRVRFIQLASAGADEALKDPMWKDEEDRQSVIMSTAAGVHMGPIPQVCKKPINLCFFRAYSKHIYLLQYFIMVTLSLFHHLQEQILISHNEKRWGKDIEVGGDRMFVQELGRKTVGVLGYGHVRSHNLVDSP
jgi:phosphoglycerate dehydrogenase-like enzyme